MAAGAVGTIQQSDRPTIENLLLHYIEVARYLFYYIMFTQLLNTSPTTFNWQLQRQAYRLPHASSRCTSFLFDLVVVSKVYEGIGRIFFGFSYSRVVAKWTKNTLNNNDNQSDYNYLVTYQLGIRRTLFRFCYRTADEAPSKTNDNVTTINEIRDCFKNSDDGIPHDDKNALKDVCLSFALFELLKRRYFGWICAEAGLPKTQDLFFKELLPRPDVDYKRAFRIIETELGFFYDFLYTKHNLMFATGLSLFVWIVWFLFFLGKIILIVLVGVYALKKSLILETPRPLIEVHSQNADYIVTLAFLFIILMVKLLQVIFYLASDWFKVSLTCMYAKRKSRGSIAFILAKTVVFCNRFRISARCRNAISQYSFISDRSQPTILNKMKVPAIKVEDAVKRAIAMSLKSSADGGLSLTKGERALGGFGEYSWTLENHSQIEVMLIWHIATDYCAVSPAVSLSDGGAGYRDVAVNLSRYYAYLIAYIPELLPYDVADIRELIITVLEFLTALPSSPMKKVVGSKLYEEMKSVQGTEEEHNPMTIFKKGVKLGKQIENMSNCLPNNGVRLWEMMAEFWAETIIYIAPSRVTTKQHMEHLKSGGEFLTHIWVLLSHAGILNLDREKDQGGKPAPPAETA